MPHVHFVRGGFCGIDFFVVNVLIIGNITKSCGKFYIFSKFSLFFFEFNGRPTKLEHILLIVILISAAAVVILIDFNCPKYGF